MSRFIDCGDHPSRLLRGVTRNVRITLTDAVDHPVDLTAAESIDVTVYLDGAGQEWILHPDFEIEGENHNIVSFVWYADEQRRCGRYTIDVVADFGNREVSRIDWHREFGIELVEHSIEVTDGTRTNLVTDGTVDLSGMLVVTTAGLSAFEQWLVSDDSQGYPRTVDGFFAWIRQPATDAETAVETAEADRVEAENDRVAAETDRVAAEAAREAQAASDHRRAEDDHSLAINSVEVTVDGTTGRPSASTSLANNVLSIGFSGLKGEQGNSGYQGAAGELELVNNLEDGGATKALSAEMGKVLAANTLYLGLIVETL